MSRTDSASWTQAKAQGDAAEVAVARWLWSQGREVTRTFDKASYDLLVLSRVEVKHDLKAVTTGNAAFEVSCNGDPSGIAATAADVWAVVVGTVAYVADVKKLRPAIIDGQFREISAGDGRRSVIRLVPIDWLRSLPCVQTIPLEGYLR